MFTVRGDTRPFATPLAAAFAALLIAACGGEGDEESSAAGTTPVAAVPDTSEAESNRAIFDGVKACLESAGFSGEESVIGEDGGLVVLTIPPGTDYPDAEVKTTLDYSTHDVSFSGEGFGLIATQGDPAAITFGFRDGASPDLETAIYDCAEATGILLPPDASPDLKSELSSLEQAEPVN